MATTRAGRVAAVLDANLAGLDALDVARSSEPSALVKAWSAAWPKLLAIGLGLLAWQGAVWARFKPDYVLPGPAPVFRRLAHDVASGRLLSATATTLQRAAIGSLITGLQTMPSVAWFPLAILLFQLSESAITFVVVLGAAPAIANGVIAGVDSIPPLLLRAGRALGARGLAAYRHVIVPASLPGVVSGLKQGWAFAWRSLMAGELLVVIAHRPALGAELQFARDNSDAEGLLAAMVVILIIGIVIDSLLFGRIERGIRNRRGLGTT
jgi:NitT/TauT family transport system permease protein